MKELTNLKPGKDAAEGIIQIIERINDLNEAVKELQRITRYNNDTIGSLVDWHTQSLDDRESKLEKRYTIAELREKNKVFLKKYWKPSSPAGDKPTFLDWLEAHE